MEKTIIPRYYERKKNFYTKLFNQISNYYVADIKDNGIENVGLRYPIKYFSELNSILSSITDILYEKEKEIADDRDFKEQEIEYNKFKNDIVDTLNTKLLDNGINAYSDYKDKLIKSKSFTNSKSRDRLFLSGGKLGKYKDMLTVDKRPALIEAALDLRIMEEKHNSQNAFVRFFSFREKKAMKIARENLKAALISNDDNLENEINRLIGESDIAKGFKYLKDENASKKYNYNYLECMNKTKNATKDSIDHYDTFLKTIEDYSKVNSLIAISYLSYKLDKKSAGDPIEIYKNEFVSKHLNDLKKPEDRDLVVNFYNVLGLSNNVLPKNDEQEAFEVKDLNENYENKIEKVDELQNKNVFQREEFEIEENHK